MNSKSRSVTLGSNATPWIQSQESEKTKKTDYALLKWLGKGPTQEFTVLKTSQIEKPDSEKR